MSLIQIETAADMQMGGHWYKVEGICLQGQEEEASTCAAPGQDHGAQHHRPAPPQTRAVFRASGKEPDLGVQRKPALGEQRGTGSTTEVR